MVNIDAVREIKTLLNNKNYTQGKQDSFTGILEAIQEQEKKNIEAGGTDLAYEKLAKTLEKTAYSILWNQVWQEIDVDELFGGGYAEEALQFLYVEATVNKAYEGREILYKNIYDAISTYKEVAGYEPDYKTGASKNFIGETQETKGFTGKGK